MKRAKRTQEMEAWYGARDQLEANTGYLTIERALSHLMNAVWVQVTRDVEWKIHETHRSFS